MATWFDIGSLTLAEDWQIFDTPIVQSQALRITHHSTVDPLLNSFYLTRAFVSPYPGGMEVPWRRIYPAPTPQIIFLPIPPIYQAEQIGTYNVAVKLRFPYYPVPWYISIEALIE